MHGGRTLTSSAAALALLAGLGGLSGFANAADLGGNCCADLEERIAELEATTARKGNRKVSLEIYGQVNETLLFWDDGFESNAGVYTNDNSRTRIGFRGKAKINGDWSAGYRLEIGVRAANSKRFNQDDPQAAADSGLDIRDSHWYLSSKSLGTVAVGRQATATDAITEINLSQTTEAQKYSDIEDTGGGLFLRRADGALSNLQWRRLIGEGGDQPGEGERRFDAIKYTSPEFQGFTVSAAWGADDFWDVALRYKGEFSGFIVAAGIGYGEITDGVQTSTTAGSRANIDAQQFGGSISVLHSETGLFVNFAAGEKEDDGLAPGLDNNDNFYAVQAGIERKFFPIGKTTISGEYYDYSGAALTRTLFGSQVIGSSVESYGFGIVQGVDAAALALYLNYRHVTPEAQTVAAPTGVALEDYDFVTAGGIIKF
ncbi:MAG: hypothetical protein C0519_09220 [Hyphomicrobium sp.]|nr:hypothetical protein [Hyphomicrobium sp.]PPD09280.1 MAG: hypothetical protein CTY28_00185 [Hyphomicrobium sp.]